MANTADVRDKTSYTHARAERDRALGDRSATQNPFECRAPTSQHHKVCVIGLPLEVRDGWRNVVTETHLGRALAQQLGVHIRIVAAQHADESCEERVTVAHLGCATPIPIERFIGTRGHRRVVALDDGHPMTLSREYKRRPETRHSATDHHNMHGSKPYGGLANGSRSAAPGCRISSQGLRVLAVSYRE